MKDAVTRLVDELFDKSVTEIEGGGIKSGRLLSTHSGTFSESDGIKILGSKYTLTIEREIRSTYVFGKRFARAPIFNVSLVANSDEILDKEIIIELDQRDTQIVSERIRTAVLMAHSQYVEGKDVTGKIGVLQ